MNTINIVVVSRLTFRKGVDLLVDVIPPICEKYPEVHFIIGGDGPKRKVLEYVLDKHNLRDRVELLGSVPHKEVRNVLVRGHIFLNTSLTEAFCIAIVEAASCGLFVVSTNVGGITEVLPEEMIYLANPDPQEILEKLEKAIPNAKNIPTHKFHEKVKKLYNWRDVAERTERIYDKITTTPPVSLKERFKRYYSCGPYAGVFLLMLVVVDIFIYMLLCFFNPKETIELAVNFPYKLYKDSKERYGDHTFKILKTKFKNENCM